MEKEQGRKLTMQELDRKSIADFRNGDKIPVIVVLDDVRSLHNIGSVFRTSDAFAVEKIILCGITAQPPHREIEKSALGATESVQWEYRETCIEAVKLLKADGVKVIGVEQVEGAIPLDKVDVGSNHLALVFGNEVKGVSQEVLKSCDTFIEIPQFGTKHSLNISVSVGVVLWELVKKLKA
ncbi:MAG: RNA methyltransferase [Flavobacteriales bacterium]|nr:RNA methyltransferase [Flavobacteriales bacterium]